MPLHIVLDSFQFTNYDGWIIALSAVLAALAAIFKLIWPIFKKARDTTNLVWDVLTKTNEKFEKIDKNIEEVSQQVKRVHKEVIPNSGSSMRDSINRIEERVMVMGARQDAMTELSDDVWWEADAKGHVTVVNKKFTELVGRDEKEILGANWKNTVHPDDIDSLGAKWAQAVLDQRDTEFEYRVVRPDGHIIPVKAKSTVRRDQRGQLIGWFGTVRAQTGSTTLRRVSEHKSHLPKILIVDDDVDVTTLLRLGLHSTYNVSIANSGGAALQHYNATLALGESIDVLLIDYTMPEMDGLEVVRRIRESEVEAKSMGIIFFTGAGHSLSREQIALYRIEKVVDKPCAPEELKVVINIYLKKVGKI
jgi:PAS domain S-box-containing protein